MTQSAVVAAQAWPTDIDELTVAIDNREINSIIEKQSVWTSDWTVFFYYYCLLPDPVYVSSNLFKYLLSFHVLLFYCRWKSHSKLNVWFMALLSYHYLISRNLRLYEKKLIPTYAINLHCTTIYEFVNYLNTICTWYQLIRKLYYDYRQLNHSIDHFCEQHCYYLL